MGVDSPDVVIAKGLLDQVKLRGFVFRRAAPGEDVPLVGHRVSGDRVDVIHIAGFSNDCQAVRQRTSSLTHHSGHPALQRTPGSCVVSAMAEKEH